MLNCGSSSIKYRLYQMPERRELARGMVERIGDPHSAHLFEHDGKKVRTEISVPNHRIGIDVVLNALVGNDGVIEKVEEIGAVGHRVVHGGEEFTGSVPITEVVVAAIQRYADLAPLHNPPNLVGIEGARAALPGIPQVACFDTAFHSTLPRVAYLYALPYELYERYGIRRYGFHGTSHRFVARRAAQLLGRHKYDINCITCHLGNGSSLAAVRDGHSIDTTMGLTPLEGLAMGTRSGDLDPAILFYLAEKGYDMDALNKLLNKDSGVLGISGKSNDMRTLEAAANAGDERAMLAIDIFSYRLRKYIGAYFAVLGRLDAVIFTGGIGENSSMVRRKSCSDLQFMGIDLDEQRNASHRGEGIISTDASPVNIMVIPTDEEAAIAADTYDIANQLEGMAP